MVRELRLAVNQKQPLGNEGFYETIERMAGQRREARPRGQPRLSSNVTNEDDPGPFNPLLWMSPQEQLLLESLDALLQSDAVRAGIDPIVEPVQRKLAQDRAAAMAWEPVPLSFYGESLPAFIRSSWVFILRASATTGAERHPNSHQRMMSFRGIGDLQTGDDGHWQSNLLISNGEAALVQRWVTIPPNVWHQAIVADSDWVVVSFQTVSAEELIEERPDPTDASRTQQRKYVVLNK